MAYATLVHPVHVRVGATRPFVRGNKRSLWNARHGCRAGGATGMLPCNDARKTELRRGVRVVEGARLESVYTLTGYRGFESLPLRQKIKGPCMGPFVFFGCGGLMRAWGENPIAHGQNCSRQFLAFPPSMEVRSAGAVEPMAVYGHPALHGTSMSIYVGWARMASLSAKIKKPLPGAFLKYR